MQVALIALLTAFAIDLLFGDPPNRFHPVVAMGSFIRRASHTFNQGTEMRRFWTGAGLILVGGALFSLPWVYLPAVWQGLPIGLQGILMGILVKPMFAFNGLLKAGKEVRSALLASDLTEARRLVAWHLVSRKTDTLSTQQVASATIESLAENLTDSFLAPLLFFAIGGLPLAWFYRFVNTADAMIGYRSPEFEYFGKFAARLDDVLNWLPARLAGLILIFAAGLCRLDANNALKIMTRQNNRTNSPNAGWTMAAAAGALQVVLEKEHHYRLEGGKHLPEARDIDRTLALVKTALLLCFFFCGGVILGIQSWF